MSSSSDELRDALRDLRLKDSLHKTSWKELLNHGFVGDATDKGEGSSRYALKGSSVYAAHSEEEVLIRRRLNDSLTHQNVFVRFFFYVFSSFSKKSPIESYRTYLINKRIPLQHYSRYFDQEKKVFHLEFAMLLKRLENRLAPFRDYFIHNSPGSPVFSRVFMGMVNQAIPQTRLDLFDFIPEDLILKNIRSAFFSENDITQMLDGSLSEYIKKISAESFYDLERSLKVFFNFRALARLPLNDFIKLFSSDLGSLEEGTGSKKTMVNAISCLDYLYFLDILFYFLYQIPEDSIRIVFWKPFFDNFKPHKKEIQVEPSVGTEGSEVIDEWVREKIDELRALVGEMKKITQEFSIEDFKKLLFRDPFYQFQTQYEGDYQFDVKSYFSNILHEKIFKEWQVFIKLKGREVLGQELNAMIGQDDFFEIFIKISEFFRQNGQDSRVFLSAVMTETFVHNVLINDIFLFYKEMVSILVEHSNARSFSFFISFMEKIKMLLSSTRKTAAIIQTLRDALVHQQIEKKMETSDNKLKEDFEIFQKNFWKKTYEHHSLFKEYVEQFGALFQDLQFYLVEFKINRNCYVLLEKPYVIMKNSSEESMSVEGKIADSVRILKRYEFFLSKLDAGWA